MKTVEETGEGDKKIPKHVEITTEPPLKDPEVAGAMYDNKNLSADPPIERGKPWPPAPPKTKPPAPPPPKKPHSLSYVMSTQPPLTTKIVCDADPKKGGTLEFPSGSVQMTHEQQDKLVQRIIGKQGLDLITK